MRPANNIASKLNKTHYYQISDEQDRHRESEKRFQGTINRLSTETAA